MLALVLLTGVPAILGVRAVIDHVSNTAHAATWETVAASTLKSAVVLHEQTGHQLLSGRPADRMAYVAGQTLITQQFDTAAATFPAAYGLRGIITAAAASWQQGLKTYGLWSSQLPALHGDHSSENVTYGAASDATEALLDSVDNPILARSTAELTTDRQLKMGLTIGMIGLFGAALIATFYFRRRMVNDIVGPVSVMQEGVVRLQSGDYLHRLPATRNDELGDLSSAFNNMCSDLHVAHLELTMRAAHDSLTGLTNRAAFTDRLKATFGPGTERRSRKETLLFLDIDDFKDINDSAGHEGGDLVLVELAQRVRASVRPYDVVARLGGDEFAIMVIDDDSASAGVMVAQRVIAAMKDPITTGGVARHVSISIGIAHRCADTHDAAHFIRNADAAMYVAKQAGKNTYRVYTDTEQSPQDHGRAPALPEPLMTSGGPGLLGLAVPQH